MLENTGEILQSEEPQLPSHDFSSSASVSLEQHFIFFEVSFTFEAQHFFSILTIGFSHANTLAELNKNPMQNIKNMYLYLIISNYKFTKNYEMKIL